MATVIAFNAHPDDEVLLTGGTLARLAAEGHRVVIVVACAGGLGVNADPEIRLSELRASASRLGAARESVQSATFNTQRRGCGARPRGSCG